MKLQSSVVRSARNVGSTSKSDGSVFAVFTMRVHLRARRMRQEGFPCKPLQWAAGLLLCVLTCFDTSGTRDFIAIYKTSLRFGAIFAEVRNFEKISLFHQ